MLKKRIHNTKNIKAKHKKTFKILLYIFIAYFIISSLYFISGNIQYKLFNYAYVEAVLPGQDLNNNYVDTGIVRIINPAKNEIKQGEQVIYYFGSGNNGFYWVGKVISIDSENQTLLVTYDSIISENINISDVEGIYVKNANFIGMLAYFSSFLTGYLLIIFVWLIILFGYYNFFYKENRYIVFAIRRKIKKTYEAHHEKKLR